MDCYFKKYIEKSSKKLAVSMVALVEPKWKRHRYGVQKALSSYESAASGVVLEQEDLLSGAENIFSSFRVS